MLTVIDFFRHQNAITEIAAISSNPTLSYQVLLIIGLIEKGINPLVNLTTKKDSSISGEIIMCTGYSFYVASTAGYVGNINFSDIDKMNILKGA